MAALAAPLVALCCCAPATAIAATDAPAWRFEATEAKSEGGEGGVGMVLDGKGDQVVVARVVPGGPAATAGIRPGDAILKIEGKVVAAGASVASVAKRIRGAVGTTMTLEVRQIATGDGADAPAPARTVRVTRASLSSLFPLRIARALEIRADVALVASAASRTVGVRFINAPSPTEAVRYEWAAAEQGQPLGGRGSERGQGLVQWTAAGATIQVADWRLDLAPWHERGVLVAAGSNLPVTLTDAGAWLDLDPSLPRYVTLRQPPKRGERAWPKGPCALRVRALLGDKPLDGRRLTVELRNERGQTLPSLSTVSDTEGAVMLSLPAGEWTAVGVIPSHGGGGRDAAFEGELAAPIAAARCDERHAAELTLTLTPRPASAPAPLPATALASPLVGKALPAIAVRRWLGEGASAPTSGKAMLLYVFATWCGPCKRVSPEIYEVAAVTRGDDVRVVVASVDRDEAAIEDYVGAQLPGGPPIAWTGSDLLEVLGARGIPTTIAVDRAGIVRAAHTGTGISVETWAAFLRKLAEQPAAKVKTRNKRARP